VEATKPPNNLDDIPDSRKTFSEPLQTGIWLQAYRPRPQQGAIQIPKRDGIPNKSLRTFDIDYGRPPDQLDTDDPDNESGSPTSSQNEDTHDTINWKDMNLHTFVSRFERCYRPSKKQPQKIAMGCNLTSLQNTFSERDVP